MAEIDDANSIAQIEQAFFNDGYHLASSLLDNEISSETQVHSMQQLYAVLDGFIEAFLQNANESENTVKCEKGCAWCCSQAVFAQSYEFKYLKSWMFSNLSFEEIEAVRKRAKEKLKNTMDLSREERLQHKEACPLLENGLCMAYEARPVACRIYVSSDMESCKREFLNPDAAEFPKLFNLPIRAGRKLNEGYAKRLSELEMETKEFSLEEGLLG